MLETLVGTIAIKNIKLFVDYCEIMFFERQDQDLFRKFKEYVAMRRPDLKGDTCLVSETLKYRIQRDNNLFKICPKSMIQSLFWT